MELHSKTYPLADGHSVTRVFDETGTLQGYVQGKGSAWEAYVGRPGQYLDTFDDEDTALGIVVQEIEAANQ